MKRTKKGITLVELVVCCGIMVMLAGACTAVLVSGARLFSDSSDTARAQLQYTVKMSDGSNFSGGVVLGNVKYDDTAMGSLVDCDLKTDPLHLSSLDTP